MKQLIIQVIHKSNNASKYQIINILCLAMLLYASSVTAIDFAVPSTAFPTIQSAVNECTITNETYNIFISYGTYYEQIQLQDKTCAINLYSGSDDIITQDDIGSVTIVGNNNYTPISIRNCSQVSINGLSLINGNGNFNSYNTTKYNYVYDYQTNHGYIDTLNVTISAPGGGICIRESNCEINNSIISNSFAENGAGVFTHLSDVQVYQSTITANQIISSSGKGEAIYSIASSLDLIQSNVTDNGSTNNYNQSNGVIYIAAFDERNGYSYNLEKSVITDNWSFQDTIFIDGTNSSSCKLDNCSIVNNFSFYQNPIWFSSPSAPVGSFTSYLHNNIIRDNMTESLPQYYARLQIYREYNAQLIVDYNNIYELDELYPDPMLVLGDNNFDADPLFVSANDYRLKWTTTEKSPCIDAGVMIEPREQLYFVPDIGALEFDEFENYCATYSFPTNAESNEIKWLSFPVLYNIENGVFTNHLPAEEMFSSILDPDVLNEIAWNYLYDDNNGLTTIYYNYNSNLWENDHEEVTSPQGYKIVMQPSEVPERTIKVSGFLQPKDTPIQLYGPNDTESVENWVGYFYPATLNVFDAFDEIIDNLYSIKTQYWSMFRETSQPDSTWIGRSMPGHEQPTLSPGDMAIVKCYQDVELIWNNEAPEVPRFKPPQPEHFEFVEKLDYIPIFTDFKGGDIELPKEIAVYIDGVCKGATVVTDSLAQICAYICDDIQYNPDIEFVLYYDTKKQGIMPDYNVWNPETGSYQTQRLDVSTGKDYYMVNITTANGNSAPLPRLYISNYPNPFNPRTTIKYYVPENNKVSLRVYNAKGQLVKTLVNDKKAAGLQEITWSGTDDNGKSCSSGVYFCKMQYKNKNISQKLILMK